MVRMMRTVWIILAMAMALTGQAQRAAVASGSDWSHVQALPPGTKIYISASGGGAHCYFKSADAETLTCVKQADIKFARAVVKSVKIDHRGRSALAGMALGAGIGVGAIESAYNNAWYPLRRWDAGLLVGGVFGTAGGLVGNFTDFTRSTVYKTR